MGHLGDFNSYLFDAEKSEGGRSYRDIMEDLHKFMVQCQLMDLGYVDHPFTWEA